MYPSRSSTLLPLVTILLAAVGWTQVPSFTNYEATSVHPVRISADGLRLYAVNTSDDRLSVFSLVDPARPVLLREIPVGLRPASVAVRTASEVWVANLLSDTVSVVDAERGIVVATIPVDDEPSDIAFSGGRAFVTAATRDQVHVFDAVTRAPLGLVDVFAREPRALAVGPNGMVYALSRRSGNGTTLLPLADSPPQPAPTNPALPPAPAAGLIVRADDPAWSATLGFSVPDLDVFEIDPATLTVTRSFAAVGTTNFDLVVHPQSGEVLIANTEARNLVRFVTNLRGHVVDNRITRVQTGAVPTVTPIDLNPGVSYATLPDPGGLSAALSDPTGLALDAVRDHLWIAAQGTDRVALFDLATDQVVSLIGIGGTPGATVDTLQKRGPRGLALHPTGDWLYVHNRLSSTLSVIDTVARSLGEERPLGSHDPVPPVVRDGRKFLYDAKLSGNGTVSCASCHVDGEADGLAWDLGDPGGSLTTIPVALQQGAFANGPPPANFPPIHPMKGPLVTQTLRGMEGRPHWRGDLDDFTDFNATFDSLMGGAQLPPSQMAAFAAWSDTVEYPPNPNQQLDRSLTAPEQGGFNRFSSGFISCQSCHALPLGSNLKIRDMPIGADQPFKIAHLRNYYRKSTLSKDAGGPVKMGFGLFKDGEAGIIADVNPGGSMGASGLGGSQLEAFLRAFDTGTAPTVGHQVFLDAQSAVAPAFAATASLLESRAQLGEIDLVVRGAVDGRPAAWLYDPAQDQYVGDVAGVAPQGRGSLVAMAAAGQALLQFTGVTPGEGVRAIDRDLDGTLDAAERAVIYGNATGLGCPSPAVSLEANAPARLGDSGFALVLEGALPGSPGYLAISTAPASDVVLGLEILVDLTQPTALFPVSADPRGGAVLSLPIPGDPALSGLTFYAQAVAEPCAGSLAATRGLAFTLQP